MLFQLHSYNKSTTNKTSIEHMKTTLEEISEEVGSQHCARSRDRRLKAERRRDMRTTTDHKQGFKVWVKSLTSPRLGVDRRKGTDQRQPSQPVNHNFKSLLTQEEIADLLK